MTFISSSQKERELIYAYKDEVEGMRADNARLRATLAEYAKDENWKMNARFDPNSPRFDGTVFARRALERKP